MPSTSTTFLGFKLRRWRCWCSDGARRRGDYFRRLNKDTHSHQSQHQLHRKLSCAEEVIRERKRGKYSKDRTETQDLKRTRKFNELRTSLRSLGLLPGLFLLNLSDLIKQSSTILVTLILTFLGFRMKNSTLIESINQSTSCFDLPTFVLFESLVHQFVHWRLIEKYVCLQNEMGICSTFMKFFFCISLKFTDCFGIHDQICMVDFVVLPVNLFQFP